MNGLLYCLVVVIWGTTWIAIYLQQGPVAAPVSIFWRFAIASTVMIAILLISGKLRKLSGRDHLFCLLQGGCVFCFNFWCFYTAAAWINTGLESVIFSMKCSAYEDGLQGITRSKTAKNPALCSEKSIANQ